MCISQFFDGDFPGSYVPGWQYNVVRLVAFFAVIAMIITFRFLYRSRKELHDEDVQLKARGLFVFWSLFPPLSFWFEYHVLWRPYNDPKVGSLLERFQYSQELSEKIWLAMVAVLAGFCWAGLDKAKRASEGSDGSVTQPSGGVPPVETSKSLGPTKQ